MTKNLPVAHGNGNPATAPFVVRDRVLANLKNPKFQTTGSITMALAFASAAGLWIFL